MFPTIAQLANNLRTTFHYTHVEYNPHTCMFTCEEDVEVPCYDSGGGLDSVGFESVQVSLTFKRAYDAYFDGLNLFNKPIVAPVLDYYCDDDLPF